MLKRDLKKFCRFFNLLMCRVTTVHGVSDYLKTSTFLNFLFLQKYFLYSHYEFCFYLIFCDDMLKYFSENKINFKQFLRHHDSVLPA